MPTEQRPIRRQSTLGLLATFAALSPGALYGYGGKEKASTKTKYSPCPCGSGKKFKFCCWNKTSRKDQPNA